MGPDEDLPAQTYACSRLRLRSRPCAVGPMLFSALTTGQQSSVKAEGDYITAEAHMPTHRQHGTDTCRRHAR